MVGGSSSYNLDLALRLDGALDVEALERTLAEIVRRHEVLRTTFAAIDGEPVQVVASETGVPLRLVDLRDLEGQDAAAKAGLIAAEENARPFDLVRGPLLRATLVRIAAEQNLLLLALHHIVTDAWSMGLLYDELTRLYAAFSARQPSPLAPLPVQYADFALWQRQWLSGDVLARQVAYWRERLTGAARLELPTDHPRPALRSSRGSSFSWTLPAGLGEPLRRLGQAEGATLFMTMLAGFAALLARYTGQEDVVVGSPIANRTRAELDRLMGFFVNTLVLRIDLAGSPSLRQLVGRVRETAVGAYAHQDLPFERLVEELQPARDLSRNPLFDVAFHLQTLGKGEALRFDGVKVRAMESPNHTAKFDLSLGIWDVGDAFAAQLEYSTDLFERPTIERLALHLGTLLEAAAGEPDRPIATLPLLTEGERAQILGAWNDTAAPVPETPVHRQVQAQAALRPDAIAVQAPDGSLTYAQLEERANRLAHWLRARGIGRETLVAVELERSTSLIVALLAILKAGAAFLPLDPEAPPARNTRLVEDAGAALLLSRETWPETGAFASTAPEVSGAPGDLAYVIYTSGSTGAPKGVEIEQRSLAHLVAWHVAAYGIAPADRCSQVAGLAFDAAVWEIWPCLASGASLRLIDEASRSSPARLLGWLAEQGVTVAFVPTPMAEALLAADLPEDLALRLLLTGGDVLHAVPARALPFTLVNHYGPTENTVVSTATAVSAEQRARDPSALPAIGRPIANTEAYVLDPALQPVPIGVPGELYVGGAGLARGYRGRPALTAERFVAHPCRAAPAGQEPRLYRTGDRVRWRADGLIDFLGRLDDQIKLHGFRIEPGEIEAALARHPAVAAARVIRREDTPGDPRLVAYLVVKSGRPPAADVLARFLRDQLPAPMVPAAFVWIPALPLTLNGKLDRAALPAPGSARPELETRYGAPQDQLERTLAEVWCAVLGIDRVGRDDNFFDLGGRSLLLVRVHSQLREQLGDKLSILDLFRFPTIRAVAAHLRDAERTADPRTTTPREPPPDDT